MADTTHIDWNTTNTSTLISIGTHSLFTSTHGLPRTSPSQPIIILISGTAGTTARWAALIRALSPHARILAYDRSGIGRSEPSPVDCPLTLDSISSERHALLKATNLPPPYILLGHSWGGMQAVHFASTFPSPQSAIAGLVVLDAGAPTSTAPPGAHKDFTTDPGSPWSHPCVFALAQGFSPQQMLHVMSPRELCSLTDEEYSYLEASTSTPTHLAAAGREFSALQSSYLPFYSAQFFNRSPPTFSGIPISTVHSHAYTIFQRLYDTATSPPHDNGSETQRDKFRNLLETWRESVLENQKQFLTLTEKKTGKGLMAKEGTGHDAMMMDVDTCVEAVRWVLERTQEGAVPQPLIRASSNPVAPA